MFFFWFDPRPQKAPHHWLRLMGSRSTYSSWYMHVNKTARGRKWCRPEKQLRQTRVFGEAAAHE
jgi:hypothetical protein